MFETVSVIKPQSIFCFNINLQLDTVWIFCDFSSEVAIVALFGGNMCMYHDLSQYFFQKWSSHYIVSENKGDEMCPPLFVTVDGGKQCVFSCQVTHEGNASIRPPPPRGPSFELFVDIRAWNCIRQVNSCK